MERIVFTLSQSRLASSSAFNCVFHLDSLFDIALGGRFFDISVKLSPFIYEFSFITCTFTFYFYYPNCFEMVFSIILSFSSYSAWSFWNKAHLFSSISIFFQASSAFQLLIFSVVSFPFCDIFFFSREKELSWWDLGTACSKGFLSFLAFVYECFSESLFLVFLVFSFSSSSFYFNY